MCFPTGEFVWSRYVKFVQPGTNLLELLCMHNTCGNMQLNYIFYVIKTETQAHIERHGHHLLNHITPLQFCREWLVGRLNPFSPLVGVSVQFSTKKKTYISTADFFNLPFKLCMITATKKFYTYSPTSKCWTIDRPSVTLLF